MDYIFSFSLFVGFLLVLWVLPRWIKRCNNLGLVWEDMNKKGHPKNVASSGGVVVILSFVISVLSYLFLKTFFVGKSSFESEIFALLGVVLIFGIIGLTDDLFGWQHGGLSKRARILLSILASIPLVVINAGVHEMTLPFFGVVNFGLIYPLLLIPLMIGFVSTTYNFLAGFNGLEAGLGILILGFFSAVAFISGTFWLGVVGLCMVSCLTGFLIFNWYPAKVFPGDILTYGVGAVIVGMSVLGNFEKILLIVYIPFLIEVVLKARGKFEKQSFGKVNKEGYLEMPYKKIYGLTHFSIWFLGKFQKVREKDVVLFIYLIELFFIFIASLFISF